MRAKPLLLAAVGLLASAALASPADREFVKKASQGNRAEVMLGRLAAQQGGSASIRRFGRQMVSDHGKSEMALSRIARRERIALPARGMPEAQDLYRRLRRLHGKSFDLLYRKEMIEDHQKDIAEFTEQTQAAQIPAVRRYAANTLPTLKMHLGMIQATRI